MDAAFWDQRYDTAEFVWATEPNRFLPPEVEGLTPGRALDVACGEGRNAVWLATQGWDATGIDFSAVTKQLEDEGVASFQNAYVGMLEAIQKRHDAVS